MKTFAFLLLLLHLPHATGQEQLIFEGLPSKRIERTTDNTHTATISGLESRSAAVRITKSGDNYFWESQNNTPMTKIGDGIYVTYLAIDGSGYVRTLNSTAREVYQRQSPINQLGQTMYVEHILIGLDSITYYGR
ncbi:MAG TPA: hypothetical protein DCM64_12820 [Gammaproteobacteria bacterium]|jgi:hypothetical protein|nr:hypothetical protein [Gammaproteobacteria bacterium]HAJ77319.1 hypothetical protein [Gammaproteobacteria bacterium]|tara:strand:- start:1348 stop:1752 length:405 start_codon:yes stop_codon:yes gene_type:complete